MSENLIFNINLDIIFKLGVTINQFFFLQLVHSKKIEIYKEYLAIFHQGPINKEDVRILISKNLLQTIDGDKITFENLKITKTFVEFAFVDNVAAIQELKDVYPKQTPLKKRRLQADEPKWARKYLSIIKGDKLLHDKIILCIKAELQHRRKIDQEEYWALLLTYVNNKRWEQYLDDIDDFKVKEEITNNYDI